MSYSDRDITRDFLKGIIATRDDESILQEGNVKMPVEDFSIRVASIFINRAEELGHISLPEAIWADEVTRLSEGYNPTVLTIEEHIECINLQSVDDYIADVALLYESNIALTENETFTTRRLAKDFLYKLA